ncbi:DNA-3-methyladenine glycosylase I [Idiomarina xiamenensis]|uniref:DNA-3-methyladenine glycosylase I n=1 Tax=Idiomarina xiamenensis 10-D-4 TaxID=740709 RepID=K2JIX2_9GAMM|nr:DNA-3-methyladenine glycosylase I [Idiomarina xiamenensis]EKE83371.1 3-methyladenine DNA glycosylase [Idiomarina xiamenensis 10-D-4]
MSQDHLSRCGWCGDSADYQAYHDHVWGRPVAASQELFEKLCLDGQQAGLSWITILRKQQGYRDAYCQFDPAAIVQMPNQQREKLIENPEIIRNKLKIKSIFQNAEAYLRLQDEGIDFNQYLWSFSDGQPRIHRWQQLSQVPVYDDVAEKMSKALKKRGFNFVGPTICYAFMQAVGMVNDHLVDCHCYADVCQQAEQFTL